MVIGIEAERANTRQKTGVEHYAKQLILRLAEIDQTNHYVLYLRTAPEQWFLDLPKNFLVKVMPFPLFWTQLRLSWEMLIHPVDVLFIPASAMPVIHPKRSVVTIHDLAWKFYPETFTWFDRHFLEWSTGFAARRAACVLAVSEATKKDLVKFYKVDEKKVRVVHHGYEDAGSDLLSQVGSLVVNGISLPDKYILFLSTLQPRKNLEGLIDAFRLVKQQNPELPHKLVVVGKPGWKFEGILQKMEANKDIIVYLNHVSDSERLDVLKRADLLALPSFYEGFGMQILESFAAGTPVVTSNISSMPEVAEDAAIYFDPKDTADMARAIKSVLVDRSLSEKLKSKGKDRLNEFGWDKCARQTLEALTKI